MAETIIGQKIDGIGALPAADLYEFKVYDEVETLSGDKALVLQRVEQITVTELTKMLSDALARLQIIEGLNNGGQ